MQNTHKDTLWKQNGVVAWLGWGGDAGIDWAQKIVNSVKNQQEETSMSSFKDFLTESTLSLGRLKKAEGLIRKYLARHFSSKVFSSAGVEAYTGGNGSGVGIRYYDPSSLKSVRFNWTTSGNENNLSGLTVWLSPSKKASHNVTFERGVSLVQVLPFVSDILNGREPLQGGVFRLAPIGTSLNEKYDESPFSHILCESYDMNHVFDFVVEVISAVDYTKSTIWKNYKSAGIKIYDAIKARFPDAFEEGPRKSTYLGNPADIVRDKDAVLAAVGSPRARVTGGGVDKYEVPPEVTALENDQERISFEEQLSNLEDLVKLTIAGSSNACFVAGKGGVGKTFNVEETLAGLGLRDGAGYFKTTGSTSAAGLYGLLYKHREEILLFDDSDAVFKDQDSRNILKAATDTKKVRKLVWMKRGSNVVHPDDMDTDDIDAGKVPSFFEFTGKILFISNLKIDKLDPDGALRTRGFMIDISPTDTEIYDFMEKIADRIPLNDGLTLSLEERTNTIAILRKGTSKQEANLRKLVRALNIVAGAKAAGVKGDMNKLVALYA